MSTPSEPEIPAAPFAVKWGLLAGVVSVGVAVDQLTKAWADEHLSDRSVVRLVDGFVELRYARNPGAFFSMGGDLEPDLRRALFVIVSGIASVLITRLYLKADPAQRALRVGLSLLLAGAVGNLIDRVRSGEVIDFVHMYWRGVFDWATYNIADVLLVAGVACLVVDLLTARAAPGSSSPTPNEADA
ncbi:MAG: signal peptidase II [Sandaracinaceae bacterium]